MYMDPLRDVEYLSLYMTSMKCRIHIGEDSKMLCMKERITPLQHLGTCWLYFIYQSKSISHISLEAILYIIYSSNICTSFLYDQVLPSILYCKIHCILNSITIPSLVPGCVR